MTRVVVEKAVQFRYRVFLKDRPLRSPEEPETGEYHDWLMTQYGEWSEGLGFPRNKYCPRCKEERKKDWGRMGFISCGESGYRAALYHGAGTYDDFDAWLANKFALMLAPTEQLNERDIYEDDQTQMA